MQKAVGYIRVSPLEQAEGGESLQAQGGVRSPFGLYKTFPGFLLPRYGSHREIRNNRQ